MDVEQGEKEMRKVYSAKAVWPHLCHGGELERFAIVLTVLVLGDKAIRLGFPWAPCLIEVKSMDDLERVFRAVWHSPSCRNHWQSRWRQVAFQTHADATNFSGALKRVDEHRCVRIKGGSGELTKCRALPSQCKGSLEMRRDISQLVLNSLSTHYCWGEEVWVFRQLTLHKDKIPAVQRPSKICEWCLWSPSPNSLSLSTGSHIFCFLLTC